MEQSYYSKWISYYEFFVEKVKFVPCGPNNTYLSKCAAAVDDDKPCDIDLVKYRRVHIYDLHRIRILQYKLIRCIYHNYPPSPKKFIDPLFQFSKYSYKIKLHPKEWNNPIKFYIIGTSTDNNNRLSTHYNDIKKNKYTFAFMQFVWSLVWKGICLCLFFIVCVFLSLFVFFLKDVDIQM